MSELINNRQHRIQTLKHIIKHLHEGQAPEQVRSQLAQLVKETDASEIAAMEQELIADGMSIEEVQSMCDMHSAVVRDILSEPPKREIPPGHPVDTMRRENEALSEAIQKARTALKELQELPDDADPEDALFRLRVAFNDIMDVDKHYNRKENLLFSVLERHGITGPSKVMWGKDDEARAFLKSLGEALHQTGGTAGEWKLVGTMVAAPALDAVEEMIYKENNILIPMSLEAFTDDEWAEIWEQSPEYGWCIVEPQKGYTPPETYVPKDPANVPGDKDIMLPTGSLSLDQLLSIFKHLPVDLTYVDDQDRVRFFSEGPDRVFSRSKAVIGRKVQHCHPPKSVHIVDQILTDFREGTQSVAEFWINFQGKRFINIRYFAVRDDQDNYMGTLEVTQDITHIKSLEGERRLLQYD